MRSNTIVIAATILLMFPGVSVSQTPGADFPDGRARKHSSLFAAAATTSTARAPATRRPVGTRSST